MNAYWRLTLYGLRAFVRDRAGLVWSFAFPLLFIVLFGAILGRVDNSSGPRFPVGLVFTDPSSETAWIPGAFQSIPMFQINRGSEASESDALARGHRSVVVVFPADFAQRVRDKQTTPVRILYNPGQAQTAQMVMNVVTQVIGTIDKHLSNSPTLVLPAPEPISPAITHGGKPPRQLDYMLPGILAMTLIQLGVFTAVPFITMREKGILKRLRATPLPRVAIVGSQVTLRLIIGVAQTIALVSIGGLLYQFHMACSWLTLLGIVMFGLLTFICIGALLASVAKTQEAGMPMVQIVNLPMILLSGLFLPMDLLPHGLVHITNALPSTYLGDAMRHEMLGVPAAYGMPVDMMMLSCWMIGCLIVAARLFRWE